MNRRREAEVTEKVTVLSAMRDGARPPGGVFLRRGLNKEGVRPMQAVETLVPRTASRIRRIDMRIVLGVILMLFAVVGTATVVQRAQARIPVLVAAEAVEAGEVIEASDIKVADLSVGGGIAYLAASRQNGIVGQIAAEPLSPGKVLTPSSVVTKSTLPSGYVAMSVSLKPYRAASGSIHSGDHVAVIASPTQGRDEPTTILFKDVAVQSVQQAQTSEGSTLIVTLRLRLEEARALAEAQAKGSIDLVLLSKTPGEAR